MRRTIHTPTGPISSSEVGAVLGTGVAPTPVVFLHAFAMTGGVWRGVAERIATGPAGARRCLIPDLRGHGGTPAADAVTLASLADDVAAVLDDASVGRAVVAGLSMGGMVALEFLRRHEARCAGLALCGTRADVETAEGAALRDARAETARREGSSRVFADALITAVLGPEADTALRARVHDEMAGCDPRGSAAAARAIARRADARPLLAHIRVPVLFVVGRHDAITTPEATAALAASTPGARLEIIDAAGHLAPLERPEAVADVIRAWLDERGL